MASKKCGLLLARLTEIRQAGILQIFHKPHIVINMQQRHLCTLLLAVCCITSCSSGRINHYNLTPPSTVGGRMCISQCQQAHDYCDEGCTLKYRTCITGVQMRAMQDYDQYTREQVAKHLPIEFRPRDFESTAPCENIQKTCNTGCDTSYHSCYMNCGGSVTPIED
jgi:hypothetical protein